MSRVNLNLVIGPDAIVGGFRQHQDMCKEHIEENMEALHRAATGKSKPSDKSLLFEIYSILQAIKKQLPSLKKGN